MSKEHHANSNLGNQYTTAAMAPQDTYQVHDNGPATQSRRSSSISKIEHHLSSSSSSSIQSSSGNTAKAGSKRASTAPPNVALTKKQKVTHRLIVPDSQPLKEKPVDAYRDAIEEPHGNVKDEHGKCLTCIKHNRACKGTAVFDRYARNKTTKRCATCMPQQNAHCGRICYWKDPAKGIYTYDDAQDYHKGIRNPKNSRNGRHNRALDQQGATSSSVGPSTNHGHSHTASRSTMADSYASGFTPINGQSSNIQHSSTHCDVRDGSDDGDDTEAEHDQDMVDERAIDDHLDRLLKTLEAQARMNLTHTMRGILPSDAQVYFGMGQILFVEKHAMTRQVYAGLWKRLQTFHVQIIQGSSNHLVAVPQKFELPIRSSSNTEGKGKGKAAV